MILICCYKNLSACHGELLGSIMTSFNSLCTSDSMKALSVELYFLDFVAIGLMLEVRFENGDGGEMDSVDRAQIDKGGLDPPKCNSKLLCSCRMSSPISTSLHGFSKIESLTSLGLVHTAHYERGELN